MRLRPGRTRRNCNRFGEGFGSTDADIPPRLRKASHEPLPTGSQTAPDTMGKVSVACLAATAAGVGGA
jgi:hypothetical protein